MLSIVSFEIRPWCAQFSISVGINLSWFGYSFVTIVTTSPCLDKAWFVSDISTRLSTATTLH